MVRLYPEGSLEDLLLRGYLFNEAAGMCRMGPLPEAYRRQVKKSLDRVDPVEYRAMYAAGRFPEARILAILDDWADGILSPADLAEALGFSPRIPGKVLRPPLLFGLMGYESEWEEASSRRRALHGRRRSEWKFRAAAGEIPVEAE